MKSANKLENNKPKFLFGIFLLVIAFSLMFVFVCSASAKAAVNENKEITYDGIKLDGDLTGDLGADEYVKICNNSITHRLSIDEYVNGEPFGLSVIDPGSTSATIFSFPVSYEAKGLETSANLSSMRLDYTYDKCSVEGNVIDSQTLKPVTGGEVIASCGKFTKSSQIDSNGHYVLNNIPKNADVSISANIKGYVSRLKTSKFTESVKNFDIKVQKKPTSMCEVTYDVQGHGTAPQTQQVAQGSLITDIPKDPVCDGYVFGGWYTEKECTNKWDFAKDQVTSSITLYAKWTQSASSEQILSGSTSAQTGDSFPGFAVAGLVLLSIILAIYILRRRVC